MKSRVRLLSPEENIRTKELYQRVFAEDSGEFADYYYRCKARENRIYAIEDSGGEIVSMLHLNPYMMRQGAQDTFGEYIVAVATDEKYRHRGMMSALLEKSLRDCRGIGEPFVFLMPAAEAIYRPFGFRFVYSQNRGCIADEDYAGEPHLECRAADMPDLEALADFANARLQESRNTFAFHTPEYFETLLEEQHCQNGDVIMMLEGEQIRGYFFTADEGSPEVREPVAQAGYERFLLPTIAAHFKGRGRIALYGVPEGLLPFAEKKPLIMARIINPERFASGLTASEPTEFSVELSDGLLPENTGVYRFFADASGGRMEKCPGVEADFAISTGDFTALAFGSLTPQEAGMPEEIADMWGKINTCAPVFLNEIV